MSIDSCSLRAAYLEFRYSKVSLAIASLGAITVLVIGIIGISQEIKGISFTASLGMTIGSGSALLIASGVFLWERIKGRGNKKYGQHEIYLGNDIKGIDLVVKLKTWNVTAYRGIDRDPLVEARKLGMSFKTYLAYRSFKEKGNNPNEFQRPLDERSAIWEVWFIEGRRAQSLPPPPYDGFSIDHDHADEMYKVVNDYLSKGKKVLFLREPGSSWNQIQGDFLFMYCVYRMFLDKQNPHPREKAKEVAENLRGAPYPNEVWLPSKLERVSLPFDWLFTKSGKMYF